MAVVFTGAKFLLGAYELSAQLNELTWNVASESLDRTTFGQNARIHKGGLLMPRMSAAGLVNYAASNIDAVAFRLVGSTEVVSIWPEGLTEGSTSTGSGAAMVAEVENYQQGGPIGGLLPLELGLQGADVVVKAIAMNDFLSTALSTSGLSGTVFDLGCTTCGTRVYFGAHLTGVSTGNNGSAVTLTLSAASSSGKAGSVTVASFSSLTCKQASWVSTQAESTEQPYYWVNAAITTATSTGANATGATWLAFR